MGDERDVLAIVGSARFPESWMLTRSRRIIEGVLARQRPDLIISGGAIGVDTLAESIAREHGIPFKEYPPKNRRWEPDGFRARNIQIAEACTRLLCIRAKASVTYGSGWTHDYARDLGKLCWKVEL